MLHSKVVSVCNCLKGKISFDIEFCVLNKRWEEDSTLLIFSSMGLSTTYCTLWIRNFQWLIFFVYIFLSMLSGDFLLCQTFWSKYLWIFLAIYVDYSYFDAQVRCTYLVPNMTLTLMFNRNYNNLRYSIKKIKSLLEQKFFLLKSVCEFSRKHWQ